MKIRNGFVSNSSSSSFVVPLNRIPRSIDDLKNEFFPNDSLDSFITDEPDESLLADGKTVTVVTHAKFSIRQFLEHMLEDVKKNRPLFVSEIRYALFDIGFDSAHEKWEETLPKDEYGNYDYDLEIPDELVKMESNALIEPFIQENKGKYFYLFEYANDGHNEIERQMKDLDIFRNKKHLVVHNG